MIVNLLIKALDFVNDKYEPFKRVENFIVDTPPDLEDLYDFAKSDIARFMSTGGKIFHDQMPDDIGDGLFYNSLYQSWKMWDMPTDQSAKELVDVMSLYFTEFNTLVRGIASSDAVAPNNFYVSNSGMVAGKDIGPGPLIVWCYALTQVHRHPIYGARARMLASKCYNKLKKSEMFLLNPDGSRSKYGNLSDTWYQAPIRVLALLLLAKMAGSDDYYKTFKKQEWKLAYGDVRVPGWHKWYSEFIAFIAYDGLLSLEQVDSRKKTYLRGLRRLFVVTEKYSNGMFYAIYNKYFGTSVLRNTLIEWNLRTFSTGMRNRKVTVGSTRKDIPVVMHNKKLCTTQALPVQNRPMSNFMWNKNPFALDGTNYADHSFLDYLMLYAYPARNTYGVIP